jgi:hypothetical protein
MRIRIRLDEDDLAGLFAGAAVIQTTADGHQVEIILADIGWARMRARLDIAESSAEAAERPKG